MMGNGDGGAISVRGVLVGAALRRKVRPRARQPSPLGASSAWKTLQWRVFSEMGSADPRQVDCAKRKTEEVLVVVQDKGEPENGIFWAAWFQDPNFAGAHHARRLAHSKGFSMQAARVMGSSDGGIISVREFL